MDYRLQGKAAIVTGAGTGIGLGIARALVREGARVVINDVDGKRLQQAADSLRPHRCAPIVGDAGDPACIDGMIDTALGSFGRLDLVVANAGITLFGPFFDFTPHQFRRVVNLNLMGAFFLTQRAARHMIAAGREGSIVLMSSVVGCRAYPHLTAYGMTKAALRMMARSLVLDLAPHKIRINALAPGATLTERTRQEDPDYAGTWSKLTPLGRSARPEDIAEAALFLLSPAARHITGQTLTVDGGWTSSSPLPERIFLPQAP